MVKIYIAAYKEFGDYKTLKKICDYFLSRQAKENVLFYVSTGESGDNTCMKYVRDNGYNYIDWLPIKRGVNRSEAKIEAMKKCDHSILFSDGQSVGIGVAIRHSLKYVKHKTVLVRTQMGDFSVYINMKKLDSKKIDEL